MAIAPKGSCSQPWGSDASTSRKVLAWLESLGWQESLGWLRHQEPLPELGPQQEETGGYMGLGPGVGIWGDTEGHSGGTWKGDGTAAAYTGRHIWRSSVNVKDKKETKYSQSKVII